jgi:hypothetical protein
MPRQPAGERAQAPRARGVHRRQVVDGDHDRPRTRRGLQRGDQCRDDGRSVDLSRVLAERGPEDRAVAGVEPFHHLLDRHEQLAQSRERQVRLVLDPLGAGDPRSRRRGRRRRRVEHGRAADARRPGEQQGAAVHRGLLEEPADDLDLRVPADQGDHVGGHQWSGPPRRDAHSRAAA